ncbi:hypothetical protein D5086_020043 [Populus alba]|uniref:Uncharacterized protein n=1 Tax=Populus alba TaxID=43335 RepID=A0ACC4BJA9_POPAL
MSILSIFLFLNAVVFSAHGLPSAELPAFREAPAFRNGRECPKTTWLSSLNNYHDPAIIHIAMTLDATYLRGSVAGVLSVLQHAACPENVVFHFIATHRRADLRRTITSTFPYQTFHLYHFNTDLVKGKISSSIRRALDQPLNYARIYLADHLPMSVRRIIYFDSDLILVDDVAKLWNINLAYAASLRGRRACYFNTGVMVIDLGKWREGKYTERLEYWMKVQKKYRIYELGSLPPFLLVFAGDVEGVEHRWNQHGLGGDNLEGLCRDLHPGPVSLLHWSEEKWDLWLDVMGIDDGGGWLHDLLINQSFPVSGKENKEKLNPPFPAVSN